MSAFQKKGSAAVVLALLVLSSAFTPIKAQIIFKEDFQTGMSFTLRNLDGLTPDATVSYVTDAWVRRADLEDPTDTIAVSTSWYDPAGTSNDWMISPVIHIDSQTILSWVAKAQDPDFPDGYQVRISTTDTAIASFMANPALLTIPAEDADWVTHTINFAAAGYQNQNIYLAWRNFSNDMFLLKVDDIQVRNPFPVDARAISVQVPVSGCQLSNAESISVTVENYGGAPLTNFDVTYVVDDGATPVSVTETVTDTIPVGQTGTYTFTQGADFSSIGTVYGVTAYVSATGDADLTNDSITDASTVINVESYDLADPYESSFETVGEILGWSTQDANNDSVTWFLASGDAYDGDNFFVYQYNQDAVTPGNDWLFSTCLDMTAGKHYELKFAYKVGNANGTIYNEKLKVAIGNSPNASSMTTVLKDFGDLVNDFYQPTSISFDAPGSGTYFIGFHCYSDADAFILAVDDITVQEQLAPTAGFTTSKDSLEVTFLSTSTDADSLHWDFGDDSTSTNGTVVHTYAAPGTYYVCLTAVNEVGSDIFCDSVLVGPTNVGITLINESEFSVFPNPTKGTLVVELNEKVIGNATLTVSDLVGKTLIEQPVNSARMTFDLSGKPEGIYFITLQAGESQLRRKVIVAR